MTPTITFNFENLLSDEDDIHARHSRLNPLAILDVSDVGKEIKRGYNAEGCPEIGVLRRCDVPGETELVLSDTSLYFVRIVVVVGLSLVRERELVVADGQIEDI